MKRNIVLLLITLLLALLSILLYRNNKTGSISHELHDFAIDDTAAVTKIFLAGKKDTSDHVTLEKESPDTWKVNGKFKARNDLINALLHTMFSLQVKSPVARSAKDNVIRNLAATGIKTEIYKGTDLVKVYYVGGPTHDQLGTFMKMEESPEPFIMFLPGLNGYLTPRYSASEEAWKEHIIFHYEPREMEFISVDYPATPEHSFRVEAMQGMQIKIEATAAKKIIQEPDTIAARYYLSFFRNVQYEAAVHNMPKAKKDSILASAPSFIFTVKGKGHPEQIMRAYLKGISDQSLSKLDSLGNPLKYDLDRMYASVPGDTGLVLIQHFVFDRLLRSPGDFIKRNNRKQ